MKKTSALIGICLLLNAGLFGAGQLVKVTSQTLDGWQVSGTDLSSLAGQSDLTLPAGAQLSCSLAPGVLAVQIVSQPFFGSDPGNCPSLEVGPASLVFARDNGMGQLVLIVGNGTPTALPVQIPLGPDARSAQPLDLTLSFDSASGQITVVVPGQPLVSISGAASGSAIEVAVAAGNSANWTIGSFDVLVASPDASGNSGNAPNTSAGQKSDSSVGDKGSNAPVSLITPPPAGGGHPVSATGGPALITAAHQPSSAAHASLQIFTPPSVRSRPVQLAPAQAQGTATSK
jgi:hypothetical protein